MEPPNHLFLLVGTNPLPNYVAVQALANSTSTHLYLIYSDGTQAHMQRLRQCLPSAEYEITPVKVDEADPPRIYKQICGISASLSGTVVLNYTGGTKAMAIHTYRALKDTLAQRTPCRFVYLDVRSLDLVIEDHAPHDLRRAIRVEFNRLAELHLDNWPIRQIAKPVFPRTAEAIAKLHSSDDGRQHWQKWLGETFCEEPPWPPIATSDAAWRQWVRDTFVYQEYKAESRERDALNDTPFNMRGALAPVNNILRLEVGNHTLHTMSDVMYGMDFRTAHTLFEWFKEGWLQAHVMTQALGLQTKEAVDSVTGLDTASSVTPEFEVALMRGYQLFAIACASSSDLIACRAKLLSTVIRAEQIGGSEARVGLVCCLDEPDILRQEVVDLLGEDRVRVFGQRYLGAGQLGPAIDEWLQTQ